MNYHEDDSNASSLFRCAKKLRFKFTSHLSQFSLDSEDDRRRQLNFLLLCAGIFAAALFLLQDVIVLNVAEIVIDSIVIVAFVACLVLVCRSIHIHSVCRFSVGVMVAGLVYATYLDVGHGSKFFIMLIFPIVFHSLLGNKEGLVWDVATLFVVLTVMTIHSESLQSSYWSFVARFTLSYFCISVVAFIQERTRGLYFSKVRGDKDGLLELNRKIEELSITDKLTNVYNRRYFEEQFAEEFLKAKRLGTPLAIALCDIDYFKQVNDKHGHQAGDEILTQMANSISRSLRKENDWIARYGGEEFVMVFPNTDFGVAGSICERIRGAIESGEFGWRGIKISQTISIGISILDVSNQDDIASPEVLVGQADSALYRAKKEGRNKVLFSR